MDLILDRFNFSPNGILGILGSKEEDICYTLEHAYNLAPKIPEGIYRCVRGQHQLKSGPIETFEVTNVPNHTGILFHPGNTENDSEGCILLGMGKSGDALTLSRLAFEAFMGFQDRVDTFMLKVVHSV